MMFGKSIVFFLVAQTSVSAFAPSLTTPATTNQQRCPTILSATDNDSIHRALLTKRLEIEGGSSSKASAGQKSNRKQPQERFTLFVGNVAFDTADTELRELFSQYGSVKFINIPKNRETGEGRGFAFVDMGSPEECEAAISGAKDTMLNGRTLRVNKVLPKDEVEKEAKEVKGRRGPRKNNDDEGYAKIYVGNISFESTREDLVEFYGEYGEVKDVYIPTNSDNGRSRGFAFVTMKEEDVPGAIEQTNGIEFHGRRITVSKPLPRGEKAPPREYPRNTKLYVGNLSFYTGLDAVQSLFEEFGTVVDCYMPVDRETGGSRGFAFVTMGEEDAQVAINETDGYEMDGRILRVNEAQPKGKVQMESINPIDENYDEGDYEDGAADGEFETAEYEYSE